MSASVKHSRETNEQYTPTHLLDSVRKVLKCIDLDPATSELANTRVGAKHIFTADDGVDTFRRRWEGNVFMNPPGGIRPVVKGLGLRSNPSIFWAKLMYAWHVEKSVNAAIVLGFTMEVLQSTQAVEEFPMLRFPICVPTRRIAFDLPRLERIRQLRERAQRARKAKVKAELGEEIRKLEKSRERIVRGEQPPHGNVVVLVPPRKEHHFGLDSKEKPWVTWQGPMTRRFVEVFSELGYVRI